MSSKNIRYILHDDYGKKVGEIILPSYNLATIIIEKNGICYRPIHYNLTTNSALCYPVKKVVIKTESINEAPRGNRESAFVGSTRIEH